jgi:hypothetical protein
MNSFHFCITQASSGVCSQPMKRISLSKISVTRVLVQLGGASGHRIGPFHSYAGPLD